MSVYRTIGPTLVFLLLLFGTKWSHGDRCLTSAMSIVHNDIFIFDNVKSISLKVLSITIVLSIGS